MKIAIVAPTFLGPYGAERLLLNMAAELLKIGNEVTLFLPKFAPTCKPITPKQLKIKETGCLKAENWELFKLLEYLNIANISRFLTDDFDIINVHNAPTALASALAKKFKKLKAPVVYQCNEPPRFLYDLSKEMQKRAGWLKKIGLALFDRPLKAIDSWSVKYVDEVIAISKFCQEEMIQMYHRKINFIMPGIERQAFNPQVNGEAIRKKFAPNNEFIILTCNKLHLRKKINLLIDAVPYVLKKEKNIKVIITGDGPERKNLEDLIQRLNVQQWVVLTGFLPEKEIPQYYASCDIFVFTALREPQIGSPAEALASGKPVVAPNDGSPAETIIEGETGFLFKPSDVEDLANKIIWCIENRDKLKQMSPNCRRWVEENMTWEKMTRETFDLFQKAIENVKQLSL